MVLKFFQNFRGCRAIVITPNKDSVATLDATVAKLGMEVVYPQIRNGRAEFDFAGLLYDRDVVFLDGDVDLSVIFEPDWSNKFLTAPVIGLVGVEAPSRLKHLIACGATEFLRKPVSSGAVYTALFLGVNQYLVRANLQDKLDELERRRRGRRWIVKAVVGLINGSGLSDDEAYTHLRRESMRLRMNVEDYCETIAANEGEKQTVAERGVASR